MKYLLAVMMVAISTSASAQLNQLWQDNRDRAIDQMQRQHEQLQQRQQDLWLYGGGDWYMNDPVYGPRPDPYLQQRQRRLRELDRQLYGDDDDE